MNPFTAIGTLISEAGNIREVMRLYQKNKSENTKMIDLGRHIAGAFGALDELPQTAPSTVPAPLKQYTTQWIQESLNIVQNAGLEIDGDLGNEKSKTRAAVSKFQKDHSLKIDGHPGVQTVAVLAQERAKKEAKT